MLGAELGVRLQLWLGDTIPVPAGRDVAAALSQATVRSGGTEGDGFQLTFRLARDRALDFALLDAVGPMTRVSLGVVFGVLPEPLVEGVVTDVQVTPSDEPGASTLTASGRDVSVRMDLDERNEAYRNQPDGVIALQRLAAYATYGVVPAATQTADVPIETQRVPRQAETDLAFLRRMARRNGFVFYVEPVGFGAALGYWGPENRGARLQPALTVGMGPHGNVRGLHFSTDALAPVGVRGSIVEPISGAVIPVPALPSLKVPPLGVRPVPAARTRVSRETAQASAATAARALLADITNAPDAVRGQGELDAVRYGHVLRARQLVGVRGAGWTHDGAYYVEQVSHTLAPGRFTTSFSLKREGAGSLLPVLPT